MEVGHSQSARVQSWISNISFPTSVDEVLLVLNAENGVFDAEKIVRGYSNIRWTVPKWACVGDVIFFVHSVSAITKIRAVQKQLTALPDSDRKDELKAALERAKAFHRERGGTVLGCARVSSAPIRMNTESVRHWRSCTYALIADTYAFETPIPVGSFREFITISRTGAVTPLSAQQYSRLVEAIGEQSRLPSYLTQTDLRATYTSYDTEDAFRATVVNELLHGMSPVVYRECRCRKAGIPDSFADNVIRIAGRYIPVEAKIRFESETIREQLWKYCYDDQIDLGADAGIMTQDKYWRRFAILVEPTAVHVYDADSDTLNRVFELEAESDIDPLDIRDAILEYLTGR